MSYYNHMNDTPDHVMNCNECGKKFSYFVEDSSMWDGHDSDVIRCPWCESINGEEYGGDSISVYAKKIGK